MDVEDSLEKIRLANHDDFLSKRHRPNDKLRNMTSALRRRWVHSVPHPDMGKTVPPHRLPLHVIRRNLHNRETCSAHASLRNWMSEEEMGKKEKWRKDFENKWKNEIVKKNASYQDRPSYCRSVHIPPIPVRQLSASSNVDSKPFFYTSDSPRPRSQKEKERDSRHFIHPEWKSENISWLRFDQQNTRNIHRFSLF
ncbi:uncharacterized protein LOC125652893 isoform X1 [Ostrea edulis]|uniref:uncharacterized protein LOC125652893 isoform X1 n=1 Tax=Ostrea edulis TaxID=37623 RepID=UPI0024AF91D0|nr:uncharacterized protein LOC125652893 isoform X1 [Ostrea edulis]